MTGPIPKLPHIQQGNLLTDLSQATGNFVGGLQAERDKQRQQALENALLGIRGMEAQGRLQQYGNQDNQRYLDDARTKGFFIRPGAGSFNPQALGDLYTQGSPMQQSLMDYELLPPDQRAKTPQPPRSLTTGGMTADLFISPDQLREHQQRKQQERFNQRIQLQRAYLNLAHNRFDFQRQNPSDVQMQNMGGIQNIVDANRTMSDLENTLPQGANWAGMMKVLGDTPIGKQFAPTSLTMSVLSSEEQKYVIAAHRFMTEYFPNKIGKQMTESEMRMILPVISATGFVDPSVFPDIQESRAGAIRQTMGYAGPGLLLAIRSGLINPGDVQELAPDLLQTLNALYGGGTEAPQHPYLHP